MLAEPRSGKIRTFAPPWVVERLFAWLHWFRGLVVRYEFHAENFLGMVRRGCMKIVLRYIDG
jgi:transposase